MAIDGSKFKAVNSRDNNFTPNKVAKRQEQIEQNIQRYLEALESADRTQPAEVEAKTERLSKALSHRPAGVRQQRMQDDSIRRVYDRVRPPTATRWLEQKQYMCHRVCNSGRCPKLGIRHMQIAREVASIILARLFVKRRLAQCGAAYRVRA
ncbi:hypothetical protein ABH945_006014 [Paraburkholderia sp. GAS333]|uniref:hypothetical protein n=1 Tax=Paraburkholderia sp. GAS333 TaxID=3156279 RepID=UPI003D23D1A1